MTNVTKDSQASTYNFKLSNYLYKIRPELADAHLVIAKAFIDAEQEGGFNRKITRNLKKGVDDMQELLDRLKKITNR